MKPHLLQLEAFGPYAEPCAISFDALSDEGLFLIHGSTGAGKTFLLDALCFALYGEVSGERNLKGLKSDHAAATAVPRVSLEFSCGGARYRVERSPGYSAPKARGQGFTDKPPVAALFRLNGSQPEPIASRTTEVSREVEQLVGLNAGQFRQVILLPQGRFAEVLRAKADEREALLKTLFDTLSFERAGHWLEDQLRAARDAQQEQARQLDTLHRQAWQVWRPFEPPAEADSASDPTAEDGGLEDLEQRLAAVLAHATEALTASTQALGQAQATKAAQDRLADRWDRRSTATARLQELEAKQAVVADYRQRLQRAEQAEALRGSLEAELTARTAWVELQQRIAVQLRQAQRSCTAALDLPDELHRLDLAGLPGLDALTDARSALAARRAELTALVRQADAAAQTRQRSQQADALAQTAATTLRQATEAQLDLTQRQQATALAVQAATTARDQLPGLEQAFSAAQQRAKAAARAARAEHQWQQVGQQRDAADLQWQQRNAILQELRRRQISGMAAQLAGDLRAGRPCPVCGALEHPAPAEPSDEAVSEQALQLAERDQAAAAELRRQAAEAQARAEAELTALREQAGDAADDPDAAARQAQGAEDALRTARDLAHQLPLLHQQREGQEQERQVLQQRIDAARTEQALQAGTAADAAQRAAALEAEIRSALGPDLNPQAVLHSLEPLEPALRDLAGTAQQAANATTRLEQAATRLQQELAASPFEDAEAVRAALKPDSWRRDLVQRIEAFGSALSAVRAALADPDLADLPELRPDTAAADAGLQQADAARTSALERHSQARLALAELQRLLAIHTTALADLQGLQAHCQLVQGVTDRCTGRATPYISLQRWVLSAYLAEICRYANQRLELMTSGRYQLRLSDEGGRGGRNAGLGLRVLDAYTGEEREVNSLSGGETFQASLALALGVADTVQAHAGGVHLDALFIDEGFGSLDPDNLQLAMDELDRLRSGGRMIGVISHVAALKERICAGIAITAADTGSRARVCRTPHA
ncbi:MAG: AAA family ATPase [Vulcanococcus sp.]